MKIVFTEEHGRTHHRARYLRGGLIKNNHQVKVLTTLESIPCADLWFHGMTCDNEEPLSSEIQKKMEEYNGKIVFFSNDDWVTFPMERIPESLQKKASLFLRCGWPSDLEKINPLIRKKIGFANPFLKPTKLMPGKVLKKRNIPTSFYGAPTAESEYNRILALRLIRDASIPFKGGLYNCHFEPKKAPNDLLIDKLSQNRYFTILKDTRLGLVLHGNNPMSFRLFECLATRCLAIVQDLSCIKFVNCDLQPGVHYVMIRRDLSDLVEKIRYYLEHLDEAQAIADNGYQHFKKNFHFSGVNFPQPLYEEMVDTWNIDDFRKKDRITPKVFLMRMGLPFIHSL